MAFSITAQFNTLENAIARGEESWLVTIDGWCETATYPPPVGAGWPAGSFPFWTSPGLSNTVTGIAIGPNSDVDRAWFTYNAGPVFPVGAPVDNDVIASIRRLSVDSPLLFQQSAGSGQTTLYNKIVEAGFDAYPNPFAAQQFGLMYGFPIGFDPSGFFPRINSTLIPDAYYKDGDSVAVVTPFTNFVNPRIQFQFFLRPGAAMQPTKRFPFVYAESLVAAPIVETRLIAVPIYGRKKVVVQASCDKANSSFRIATLPASFSRFFRPREVTRGLHTGLGADESALFELCSPCADWLLLYVTAGDVNATASYNITAYD